MPASPNTPMRNPVANAEAMILTRLLPSKMAPISRSFFSYRRLIMRARRSPFRSSWCMSGREAAVNAVSEPEKKAERISRTAMALREINMVASQPLSVGDG